MTDGEILIKMISEDKGVVFFNQITGVQKRKFGGEIKIAVDAETYTDISRGMVFGGAKTHLVLLAINNEQFDNIKKMKK